MHELPCAALPSPASIPLVFVGLLVCFCFNLTLIFQQLPRAGFFFLLLPLHDVLVSAITKFMQNCDFVLLVSMTSMRQESVYVMTQKL